MCSASTGLTPGTSTATGPSGSAGGGGGSDAGAETHDASESMESAAARPLVMSSATDWALKSRLSNPLTSGRM